ncbi:hypothetical protein ABZP36_035106 [Zizania latifolia]
MVAFAASTEAAGAHRGASPPQSPADYCGIDNTALSHVVYFAPVSLFCPHEYAPNILGWDGSRQWHKSVGKGRERGSSSVGEEDGGQVLGLQEAGRPEEGGLSREAEEMEWGLCGTGGG